MAFTRKSKYGELLLEIYVRVHVQAFDKPRTPKKKNGTGTGILYHVRYGVWYRKSYIDARMLIRKGQKQSTLILDSLFLTLLPFCE